MKKIIVTRNVLQRELIVWQIANYGLANSQFFSLILLVYRALSLFNFLLIYFLVAIAW